MTCVVAILVSLAVVGSVFGGERKWDYDGDVLGPDRWHEEFPACGKRSQSPINIDPEEVVFDPQLAFFNLNQYQTSRPTVLRNDEGHTVRMSYSGQPITISGGSLPGVYVLDQFHFHWGVSSDRGSEHRLDEEAGTMEMHIVHHRLLNPSELAVLAFLFKIGDHNSDFDELLSYFQGVTYKDESVTVASFQLSSLLPQNVNSMSYYRYSGSLTTPPCSEVVTWSVFKEKIHISEAQMQIFRALRSDEETAPAPHSPIANNFRPVQALNGRRVSCNCKDDDDDDDD